MPTTSALRMSGHSERVDRVGEVLPGPNNGVHADQIGAVVFISPDATQRLLFILCALYFPLLAARREGVFACDGEHAVRPENTATNPLLPFLIVGLFYLHIDVLEWGVGVSDCPF